MLSSDGGAAVPSGQPNYFANLLTTMRADDDVNNSYLANIKLM